MNIELTPDEVAALAAWTPEEEEFLSKLGNKDTTEEEILELVALVVDGTYAEDMLWPLYLHNPISEKVGAAIARAAEKFDDESLMWHILKSDRFYNMAHTIALDYFGILDKI